MQKKYLVIIGLIFISSAFSVNASKSWGEKNLKKEDNAWIKELKYWDKLNKDWYQKRDDLFEKYYGDLDSEEFCDQTKCYEEYVMSIKTYSKDKSEIWDWSKNGHINIKYKNLFEFKLTNGGQALSLKIGKEEFKTTNKGQHISYKDAKGNQWTSKNTGQFLSFNGADSSSWEGSNNGMSLIIKDASGKIWKSSVNGLNVNNNGKESSNMQDIYKDTNNDDQEELDDFEEFEDEDWD